MRRSCMLALLIATLTVAWLSSSARADTLIVDQFSLTQAIDDLDTDPSLGVDTNSKLVVFTRFANGDSGDIWFQRIGATGEPFGPQILVSDDTMNAPTNDVLNDISGDLIVYTAFGDASTKIRLFDTQTFSTFDLFSGVTSVREARIHGNDVAWVAGDTGATYVELYDVTAPAIPAQTIAGPSPAASNVEIGSTYVVWQSNNDVMAYHLATGITTPVADTSDVERSPATSGDWVVYEVAKVDSHAIVAKNLQTGEVRVITEGIALRQGPNIDGDLVTWDSSIFGELDVFLHSLSRNENFRLISDAGDQFLNNVFGDDVALVDFSSGAPVVQNLHLTFVPDPVCEERDFGETTVLNLYSATDSGPENRPRVANDGTGNWMSV